MFVSCKASKFHRSCLFLVESRDKCCGATWIQGNNTCLGRACPVANAKELENLVQFHGFRTATYILALESRKHQRHMFKTGMVGPPHQLSHEGPMPFRQTMPHSIFRLKIACGAMFMFVWKCNQRAWGKMPGQRDEDRIPNKHYSKKTYGET